MRLFQDRSVVAVALCMILQAVGGFALTNQRLSSRVLGSFAASRPSVPVEWVARRSEMSRDNVDGHNLEFVIDQKKDASILHVLGGFMTGGMMVGAALAEEASGEIEIEELPPPYFVVIFAIAILGGVGLLTGSLGDVMTEEAQLGMMSGARAKKEKERSRSSYFKK
eukprot:scaffold88403_cov55-Attheya_sp.AAC.3